MRYWTYAKYKDAMTLRLMDGVSSLMRCLVEFNFRLVDDAIDQPTLSLVYVGQRISFDEIWQEMEKCERYEEYADVLCKLVFDLREHLELVGEIDNNNEHQVIYSCSENINEQREALKKMHRHGVRYLSATIEE
ncbi:MAG: hypothetical protein ABH846_02980 [Patescibacteria group bacterium]